VDYEKYTLFDSSDINNWLDSGILCIQCRRPYTYLNSTGCNFIDPGFDAQHIVFPSYSKFQSTGYRTTSVALFSDPSAIEWAKKIPGVMLPGNTIKLRCGTTLIN